ncbi:hypothetical protein HY605_00055 [Candidatus Peregrinibacteria bacterium]|nr:hypothetical protein [Candidatus Peregrinibacteria bacterium]
MGTPKITIYEGKSGVNSLLMRNLDDKPSEVLVFGEHIDDKDHIPEYTDRRIKMAVPTRIIIPDSEFAKKTKRADKLAYRKTNLIAKNYKFPASIHIYDQSVAIFTYNGEDPVGVYIENADISTSMKMIYELMEKSIKK